MRNLIVYVSKTGTTKELIQHAFTSKHLGGRLNPAKGSMFIRIVVKSMMKDADKFRIREDKITELVNTINKKNNHIPKYVLKSIREKSFERS